MAKRRPAGGRPAEQPAPGDPGGAAETEERTPAFDTGWLRRVTDATDVDLVHTTGDRLELAKIRALFRTSFSQAPIGMAIADESGEIVIANDALCRLSGRTSDDLSVSALADLIVIKDRDVDLDVRRRLLGGEASPFAFETHLQRPDGSELPVAVIVGYDGVKPASLVYQVQDVSERHDRHQLNERLDYLIDHDLLTGLFNRRRFQQELRQQIARHRRYGASGAVVLMDLDGFKSVNDRFGHAAGDDVLRGLTAAIRDRVRESDVLARLSGDEFALLLPEADRGQAEAVATSLVNLVRHHTVAIGRERAQVTASIGVAMMGDTSDADLVALADAAMYAAKDAGRDRVVVYDPEQEHPGAARHVGDAAGVRRALRDDRFVLHAQPIWSYAEATVEKYELLIRMRAEKDGGLIPPGDFLYAAERFGLVSEIDRWVVSEAVRLIAGQAALGRRVVLAVNLSGRSLGDDSVIEHIDHVLARGDIDPGCLVFELTETAAIGNIDAALSLTHRLRAHGCKLSLDDFGAGFSSFYYLRKLPFDYIKIDGEFVRGLRQSAADRLLIDAIVTMAHGLGKLTVAEFVADEETNELVKASGVDLAQGFYIGRPEAVDDVLAAAAAGRSALSSRR